MSALDRSPRSLSAFFGLVIVLATTMGASPAGLEPDRLAATGSGAPSDGSDPHPPFHRPPPVLDTLPRSEDPAAAVSRVAETVDGCGEGCAGVIYLWSDRMPLSRVGIGAIEKAARRAGAELTLLETEALAAWAEGRVEARASDRPTADALLASGALAHAPALVAYANGRVQGSAILGYKTSPAYASALRRRFHRAEGPEDEIRPDASSPDGGETSASIAAEARRIPGSPPAPGDPPQLRTVAELDAVGRPGAYFRWVPGGEGVAYESGGRIYLLDLADGQSRRAPGYVDFVPTPDGSLFVTPAPRRRGMEFYDAAEVLGAVEADEPHRVDAFYTDRVMQDQYPSVGILEQDSAGASTRTHRSTTTYRMVTSWFEGIRYRDYRVTRGAPDGSPEIRPLGDPIQPCGRRRLSIPILSQSGLEVAARDESTGTTKILRILDDGRCEEVEDLGVQTGKVAWHWSGRLLAFARPPRDSRIGPGGIFLYDRDEGRMSRVPGSEDASALAFPEFIGSDRLVYLVPGDSGESTVFRIVQGAW